jgi:excisionase family DNA binding protein
MKTKSKKEMLRVDEVAEFLDVSRSTVYLWIDHGLLSAEKYRGVIRVPRESLKNFRLVHKIQSE